MRLAKTHITRLLRRNGIVAETHQAGDWVQVVAEIDQYVKALNALLTQGFYLGDCQIYADGRRSMLIGQLLFD